MTPVFFGANGDIYTIRFAYHPVVVETIKAVVPSHARNYSPTRKEWTLMGHNYAEDLANTLHCGGFRIVGFRMAYTDEQLEAEVNQLLDGEGPR